MNSAKKIGKPPQEVQKKRMMKWKHWFSDVIFDEQEVPDEEDQVCKETPCDLNPTYERIANHQGLCCAAVNQKNKVAASYCDDYSKAISFHIKDIEAVQQDGDKKSNHPTPNDAPDSDLSW